MKKQKLSPYNDEKKQLTLEEICDELQIRNVEN